MARILLITNIFPPAIGGPASFIDRLAHALAAAGHRVTVVCSADGSGEEPGDKHRPFRVHRVSLANRYAYEVKVRLVLARELARHRVILVNGLEGYVGPIARAMGKRYLLKVVGDTVWEQARIWGFTNLTIDEFQSAEPEQAVVKGLAQARRRFLGQARRVITPSNYLKRLVTGWGYDPARIEVIPNGIPNDRPALAPRTRGPDEPLEVVFCGRLTNWKGVETAMLAVRDLDRVRLTVIGDGPEGPLLTALSRQLQLPAERVRFTGRLPQAKVHEAFAACHVLALPSCYEGLSHTLLEAAHAGLACVASSAGGNPEVVTDGEDGLLVSYGDVDALREALRRLRDDDGLRLRLAERARRTAERFDFEQTVARTTRLLLAGEDETREARRVTHVMYFAEAEGRVTLSGAENHVLTLIRGQARRGLKVGLIMLVAQPGPALKTTAKELRAEGIDVVEIIFPWTRTTLQRRLALPAVAAALFRALRLRRDGVVHTHLEMASQLGRATAWIAGCRRIVDSIHADEPRFARWHWRLRLGLLDRLTHKTIAITEHVGDFLVTRCGYSPKRVAVVRYGVEPPRQRSDREALRRTLGLPTDARIVGFVGRLTYQKNIETLIEAIGLSPEWICAIVGAGEEGERLRRLADEKAPGRVHFLGYHSNADALMAAFDVFCLPSRFEGLGLVLLEAMLQRVPIIATRAGAIPEVLGQGKYGRLIDVGRSDQLAAALAALAAEPAETEALIARAYRWAIEAFSVETMVERTQQVYEGRL